jgi:hypothetical protein
VAVDSPIQAISLLQMNEFGIILNLNSPLLAAWDVSEILTFLIIGGTIVKPT